MPGARLVPLRAEAAGPLVTIAPLAAALIAWTAATQPAPDAGRLVLAGVACVYVALTLGTRVVRRRVLTSPVPWPDGAAIARDGLATSLIRQLGPASVLIGVSVASLLAFSTQKRAECAYLESGFALGMVAGSALTYARVVRAERRLGARFYRERLPGWLGARVGTATYAGPPHGA